jgi:hypothetical protein
VKKLRNGCAASRHGEDLAPANPHLVGRRETA